jgi:hypothetical protein
MSTQQEKQSGKKQRTTYFLALFERNIFHEMREIGEITRFELKRIIFTMKFFIALSLVLLPAIIYLDATSSTIEVLLLEQGKWEFMKQSAAGYIVLGQFLMQLIAIMLTLDGFGKNTKDSMQRYLSMPVRKVNIFFAHTLAVCLGTSVTGIFSIGIFNLLIWIWTGISLSFVLLAKAFIMTFVGALLAIATTTLFIIIANYFEFESSIAIIPTLFLFYIIPFIVYFTAQFNFINTEFQKITFMYQLAVASDYWILPLNGLQDVAGTNYKTAWIVIAGTIAFSENLAIIIFTQSEK